MSDTNLTQKDAINKLTKGIDITSKKSTKQPQEVPTPKELFKSPSEI